MSKKFTHGTANRKPAGYGEAQAIISQAEYDATDNMSAAALEHELYDLIGDYSKYSQVKDAIKAEPASNDPKTYRLMLRAEIDSQLARAEMNAQVTTCKHPADALIEDWKADYIGDWGDQPIYTETPCITCSICGAEVKDEPALTGDVDEIPF